MDIYDKYLYDEIVESHARDDLSSEDYEELYHRFENLNHVLEVKPYLFAMRYFGWGTVFCKHKIPNFAEKKRLFQTLCKLKNTDIRRMNRYAVSRTFCPI